MIIIAPLKALSFNKIQILINRYVKEIIIRKDNQIR